MIPVALAGNVDRDGQIVDRFVERLPGLEAELVARVRRVRSAIGEDYADGFDPDEQVGLVLAHLYFDSRVRLA